MTEEEKRIALGYGLGVQYMQLIEEMAELTQAIMKHRRKKGLGQMPDAAAEVIERSIDEEIADVALLLDQIIWLRGCEEKIAEIRKYKAERSIARMQKEIFMGEGIFCNKEK